MDFARQLDLTVADLNIEEVRNTAPVPLGETDQRVCITLAEFLKKTASQIKTISTLRKPWRTTSIRSAPS